MASNWNAFASQSQWAEIIFEGAFLFLWIRRYLIMLFLLKPFLKVCFCHNSEQTNIFLSWNWKFEFWWFLRLPIASQRRPSCPYKALSFKTWRHPQFLSNFQSPIKIFSFREEKCLSVWSYDKNIGTFWKKRTFARGVAKGQKISKANSGVLNSFKERVKRFFLKGLKWVKYVD